MLILRMRQAETALKDGRLDEAFDLARSADVRAHRRGQDLIGRLSRALAERGRGHLQAGRLAQATADCDKAAQLGGNLPEVSELRTALEKTAAERQDQERRKANAIGAAREHIRSGQLSIGQQWLAPVGDTYRADALRGEVEARRGEVEAALARLHQALKHDDLAAAVESLQRVSDLHSANPGLPELWSQVASVFADRLRAALQQGRLEQARTLMRTAGPCVSRSIELSELRGVLDLILRSAAAVEAGQCRRAMELLHQARTILPGATWLEAALAEAVRAAESMEHLRGGPLGMMMGTFGGAENIARDVECEPAAWADPRGLKPAAREALEIPAAGTLPRKMMLHVDGIGSFLVVRDRSVTIGAAGGSRCPDVALLMDSSAGPTAIERQDDDYFLTCGRPVLVNNQLAQHKLLSNGDRIALSNKCHVRFMLPNAASTSALLSVAGARLPATDATRVILLDRSLVIGPGATAHIRAEDLAAPAILHIRDGRLFCSTDQAVTVDGRPVDRQAGLPLNAQVRIGPLSMMIKPA